ncbi:MAG: hypothetical protein AMK72_15430 [Planctomycetes bacterium SM23_25]|nr:MAG: hypothetical protein AMK72_15430 [Planctomycetes bacterium SM23_25]
MPTTWKAVRVFISSTFRDMHAERDHLVKVVFPELRERLEAHHIHLIDIDLRWGVTAEQADNDRVLDLCLDQIDRCRPFFVGILGRRYGWVPAELPEMDQVRYGWVQAVTGKSITELEILHGVLRNPQLRGHAVFLFRKGHFLADVPEEIRRQVYEDEHAEKLGALQEEIRAYCREHDAPFHEYDCEWDGSKPNPEDGTRGRVVGLEQFGRWVADDLWAAIATEHPQILKEAAPPAQAGTDDWLAEEQDYHERFIESRTQVYIDRGKIQVLLAHYLESAATQPLVLVGGSGTGKSAILGTLFKHYRKQHGDELVLPHFVGASPSSTDLPLMLRRFCHALRSHFGLAEPIEHGDQGDEAAQGHPAPRTVPEDAERLPGAFGEFLEAVPEDRRAVLIIDAVNELNEAGHAHEMHWLPAELQPNVKIIVSSRRSTPTKLISSWLTRPQRIPCI